MLMILVVFFVEVVCECLMVNVCVFGFVNVVWLVKYIVKVISMCGNLLVYYCYFEFLNGDCILCSGILKRWLGSVWFFVMLWESWFLEWNIVRIFYDYGFLVVIVVFWYRWIGECW